MRRSDLFSAIMVMCMLVEGEHPVRDRNTDFELLVAIRDCRFELPWMPSALTGVVRRVLVRAPESRIASAGELREALVRAADVARLDIGPHVIAQTLLTRGVPA